MKFCTSAPFHAALKADVLERWPGGLVEYYGMTEGGGSCILEAHLHPTSCTPWASRPKATTSG
jgi:long-chain acyl-CoA synthetase